MKNKKTGNITLTIDQTPYGQLEREARKRALAPGDYLEMLIEMDYIVNTGCDPGDAVSVSISERHYSLLCQETAESGRGAGEERRDDNRALGGGPSGETAFKGNV